MNGTSELRQQLSSLSISRSQRPVERASGGFWKFVLLAAIAGGGYWAWNSRETLKAQVEQLSSPSTEVATVVVRAESPTVGTPAVLTATGKIVSDHRVQVVTKVSGQIVWLGFEQGDRVELGQVLARIEDVNYRARRDEALAMVEKAKSNLAFQEWELARIQSMASRTDREMASASHMRDEARAQLAADEAALIWTEKALKDTEITAPIAGVVLERNVEVGDFVAAEGGRGANANAQFASIADMSKLRVEIDVSELDIARIRKDMTCTITPDAYKDRRYVGHVMWIDPGANYAKATVQAKVRIENPDDYLRVEGSARVEFQAAEAPTSDTTRRIWIPDTAIRPRQGQPDAGDVFLLNEDRIRLSPVRIGRRQSGQSEILEGLQDGQTIVARELEKLTDGMRVKRAGS